MLWLRDAGANHKNSRLIASRVITVARTGKSPYGEMKIRGKSIIQNASPSLSRLHCSQAGSGDRAGSVALPMATKIVDAMRFLPDVSKVFSSLVEEIRLETETENCSLFLCEEGRQRLVLRATSSKPLRKYKGSHGQVPENHWCWNDNVLSQIFGEAKFFIQGDANTVPPVIDLAPFASTNGSFLCLPLFTDGNQPLGALTLSSSQSPALAQDNLLTLHSINQVVRTVVVNTLRYENLQGLSDKLDEKVKEKTESLRKTEKRYRLLLQNASDGIFIFQDGTFKLRNKRFDEMFGAPEHLPYLKDPDRTLFHQQLEKYLKYREEKPTGKARVPHVELSVTSPENTRLALEVAFNPIEYRNRCAVQGIVRDITSRKKLERLKSNFLAMAAHELRTALTLITGYNKLLLRKETGPLTPTQRKIIKGCQHSCDRLKDFVHDVLELSKLGAGRMNLNLQLAEMSQCIRNVRDELSTMAKEKNILLTEKAPPKLAGKMVSMDPNKIEQVLINLTRNAIQHSPEGGKVEIEVVPHSDAVIAVCISDNGDGVPEEERESIFDEFISGKNAHGAEGMGLGLAICKKIIELHNGKIWVEPNDGGGSKFIFCLPLSREEIPVARGDL